jgi:hypothetical protein
MVKGVKGTDLFFGSGKIEKTAEFFHLNKSVAIFILMVPILDVMF